MSAGILARLALMAALAISGLGLFSGNAVASSQPDGICLMRTSNLADPASWRGWNGSGFNTRFINPYVESNQNPADHVCKPVDPDLYTMSSTLVYSKYLQKYIVLDLLTGIGPYNPNPADQVPGVYYSTSSDLLHWDPPKLLMQAEVTDTFECGDSNPVRVPSLIDHGSGSRNYETIGQRAFLYFTRANMQYNTDTDCYLDLDRDMVRVPVQFSADGSAALDGPEEVIFDWSIDDQFTVEGEPIGDACNREDIPDAAARAYRDSNERVVLFSSHLTTRRFIGTGAGPTAFDKSNLDHPCDIVMPSGSNADPTAFNDREWLSSPYTFDGTTVYALVHEEYQGWRDGYGFNCPPPFASQKKCWRNSVTFAKSTDGGETFISPGTLVAGSPYKFASGIGPFGYFKPSNIVQHSDGYFYALVRSIGPDVEDPPPPPAGGGGGEGGDGNDEPPPPDTKAARVTISSGKKQDIDKLAITIRLDEDAMVEATGNVSVPGASKVYSFKRVRKQVVANKQVKLKLKLAGKSLKKVKRALRRGKKLTAKVKIAATDTDGNNSVKRSSIKLKP